jgi:hypothetical protein
MIIISVPVNCFAHTTTIKTGTVIIASVYWGLIHQFNTLRQMDCARFTSIFLSSFREYGSLHYVQKWQKMPIVMLKLYSKD